MTQKKEPGADHRFKIDDAGSYNIVVDYFDKYTEQFTRYLLEPLMQQAALEANYRVLDVGSGTGVVTLDVSAKIGDEGKVIGVDLSDGMLTTARQKAEKVGLAQRTQFLKMDAEALDFKDGYFDVIVSLYALRHFPNPGQALAEMYRVLSPGGKIVIGVGSAPRLFSLDGIKAVLRRISTIIRSLSGRGDYQACRYLDDLIQQYLPKSEIENAEWTEHHSEYSGSVSEMLANAGFINIISNWFGQRFIIDSAEEFWELQITFSSVARKRIASSAAESVAELKRNFLEKCNTHLKRGGRLVYATGATVLRAEKPCKQG